jgi:hypothetical protein
VITGCRHGRHRWVSQPDVSGHEPVIHSRQQPRTPDAGRGQRLTSRHTCPQCPTHQRPWIGNGTRRAEVLGPVGNRKVASRENVAGHQVAGDDNDRDAAGSRLREKGAHRHPDGGGDQNGGNGPPKSGSLPGGSPSGSDQSGRYQAPKPTATRNLGGLVVRYAS